MKSNTMQPASLIARILAFLIDQALLSSLWLVGIWYVSQSSSKEILVTRIVSAVVLCLLPLFWIGFVYGPYFLYRWGQTIGKMIVGIQVRDKRGELLSGTQSIFRELLAKPVSLTWFGIGFFWAVRNKDRQGWHDWLAGSYVIQQEPRLLLGSLALVIIIGVHAAIGVSVFQTLTTQEMWTTFFNSLIS